MAGCKVDKNLFTISYENLSSEVASQHKDWTPHQVRLETARLFRPSYHQNMESVKHELSNNKEYDGTPFVFENGQVNFIDGLRRTNILSFHENQLRDTPEKYSPEQHQTSLLIQTAFQNGAREVVTSYLESSGQRDIVVMTLDRATGKGKMRIINTLNDHTMPEMQNLVKKNFAHLSEVHPTTNAFILCDTRISKEQVEQNPIMHDQRVQVVLKDEAVAVKRTFPGDPVRIVLHETADVAKNTFQEIRYTAEAVKQFVQRSRDRKLNKDGAVMSEPFVRRVRRMFEHSEKKRKEVSKPEFHQEKKKGVERVKLTRKIIREKIIRSVSTLLFIRVTGVGVGGVFESINTITRLPKVSLESAKRIKNEKQQRQKRALGKMRAFRMSEAFKKLTKREQCVLRRKEKKLRRKEKKLLLRKERRVVRKKETILWNTLKRLVQKTGRQVEIRKTNRTKKEVQKDLAQKEHQTKKQEKQHVIDFSVVLVIWFLLRLPEKRQEVKVTTHEKQTKLIEKEQTPWLLFAIIWHLAMIREGGARTVPRQKKVKKKIQYPQLAPQGVIFAFAS